jgi:hypothetical protein
MQAEITNYDVFISHASEDKDFVRELVSALELEGLSIWYDEHELKLGDSLRESIDRGLNDSRYGIVVLSRRFFEKKWPRRELDGLAAKDDSKGNLILPLWHGVSVKDVTGFSPMLAGVFAVNTGIGLRNVVTRILEVVRPEVGRTKARVLDDLAAMSANIYGYVVGQLQAHESSGAPVRTTFKTTRDALMILTKALTDISRAASPREVAEIIQAAHIRFDKTVKVGARCLLCQATISEIDRASEVIMKSRMRALKGFCPRCGVAVFRLVGRA